ncbi:hypothetical protein HBI29_021010 [Parastagonospora nodorum]|nr:hypothetical protein HBI29_021010 [Parastagonospora nodorum]
MSLSNISPLPSTKTPPPSNPIPNDQILILPCTPADASMLASCLYTSFPSTFWDLVEPPSQRPLPAIRLALMAKRLLPSLSDPAIQWIKAVHAPTDECMGMACWTLPGSAVHNPLRKSAIAFYAWDAKMRWTQHDVEEMFAHVCAEQWDVPIARNDRLRAQFFKGHAHWYLSPVCTWPKWQGLGVGKKLLAWALERADRTGTPVYLRSAPEARGFYERVGFEEVEEGVFVRRGRGGVGEV